MPNTATHEILTTSHATERKTSSVLSWTSVVLIFAAFVLRILHINGESLWRDEVDVIRFAFAPFGELLSNLTRNGFNGPLYLLLMRAWLWFAGTNDFSLRYFSLICGVLETVLIYTLAARLFDRKTAIVALWFAVISPGLIWYSGEGKMYSLQPMLLVLALYALRKAIDGKGVRWWVIFVVSVSFGYYVHLLTPLFISVAVIFYFAWYPRARSHWRGAVIAFAACTLPYVPLAIWQLPTLIAGSVTGHDFYTLDVMVVKLLYNWSVGVGDTFLPRIPSSFALLGILASVGVALVGLFGAIIRRKDMPIPICMPQTTELTARQSAIAVLAWALVPAVLTYLISTRAPVFEPRYLLWCAPALIILIARGVAGMRRALPMVTVLLFALLSGINLIGWVSQVVYPIRLDVRGMTQYVASAMAPGDLFVFQIPYMRYGFEYYLPSFTPQAPLEGGPLAPDGLRTVDGLRDRLIEAPYTNGGATPDDVTAAMKPLTERTPRIWLIESESTMWDERGMVRAWYEEHMKVAAHRELHGVVVTLYELP
jgi:4-amino-4-deoxy-L-arabinose transferase-like glycosyltransferase